MPVFFHLFIPVVVNATVRPWNNFLLDGMHRMPSRRRRRHLVNVTFVTRMSEHRYQSHILARKVLLFSTGTMWMAFEYEPPFLATKLNDFGTLGGNLPKRSIMQLTTPGTAAVSLGTIPFLVNQIPVTQSWTL